MNPYNTNNRSYQEPTESTWGIWIRAVVLAGGFLAIQGLLERLG